jgi:hypothetical protein
VLIIGVIFCPVKFCAEEERINRRLDKNCIIWSFIICSPIIHQIKEVEMGGVYSAYGTDEKYTQSFGQKTSREQTT